MAELCVKWCAQDGWSDDQLLRALCWTNLPGGMDPPAPPLPVPIRPQTLAYPPTSVVYHLWGHLPLRSSLLTVEKLGRCENVCKWKLEVIDNPSCP